MSLGALTIEHNPETAVRVPYVENSSHAYCVHTKSQMKSGYMRLVKFHFVP